MSNSLDPDQARRFVRPDLGPNCLPRLSPDNIADKELSKTWLIWSVFCDNKILNYFLFFSIKACDVGY